MIVTALPVVGNSSKFRVVTKQSGFDIALSYTLRTKVWELLDAATELMAAKELSEAIVSRHDPELPFKRLYIFAEHNTLASLSQTVQQIRTFGIQ